MDDVKRLEVDQIVPGHGPVGTPANLEFMQRYLRTLQGTAAEIKAQGGTADTAASYPIPDEFNHLVNLAGMYQDSVRFLFERTSA